MKRESSKPFIVPTTPGVDFPDTLAEFLKLADAPGFLRNDGAGGLRWLDATATDDGEPGSLGEVGDALQLYWLYGDESPAFELFGPTFSWRDVAPIGVVEATAGDDTLDLETTEGLKVGSTYVIADAAGTLLETVEIARILTPKRLRTRLSLNHTLATSAGARLARTPAEIQDRFAIFSAGDAFYTRVLDALRLQDRGRVMLRRSSDGAGTFTVSYRLAGESRWTVAKRVDVRARRTGTRDEEYEIATGGEIEIRVTFAGVNAADRERVEFMLLGTTPRSEAAAWVEQPVNVTPANQAINVGQTPALTGSAYRSLYGLEQGGAHFQVARDPLFTDVVVNSSNDWLASWVNRTGYSQAWKGVVALAANKFLAVADGVSVRMDQTGAITVTGTVTGDLRCVAADAGLAVTAGAAGAIRTSADEGATYTNRTPAGNYAGVFTGAAVRGSRVALVGTGGEIQFAANGVIFSKVPTDGAYAGDFTALSGDGAGNVIAVGANGCIQTSNSDGQAGWTKREAPGGYTGTYRAVRLLPSGYGLAAGDNGALHETVDYGATWRNAVPDPAFAGRFTALAIAGGYAVAVGEGGAIQVKTLPNGKWQARSAGGGSTGAFRAVALDANADALALGDAGLAQRTSRLSGATISYTVPAGSDMLKTNQVYFWRVRYSDLLGRWSPWSTGTSFGTSAEFNYVRQPDNLSPAAGDDAVSVVPTLQGSPFTVVGAPDAHSKSRWQVARDLAFADVVHDSGEVNDLLRYTLPAGSPLADQQTFYWRVAYKGATNGLSAWSAPTSFRTRARPNRPIVTAPAANATNVAIAPTITTSAFSMPGGGVHDASRYQISTTASFASIAYDSGWSTADTLSHTLPAGKLAFDTAYFVRAQHRESGGQASAYSDVVSFRTTAVTLANSFAHGRYVGNGGAATINTGTQMRGRKTITFISEEADSAKNETIPYHALLFDNQLPSTRNCFSLNYQYNDVFTKEMRLEGDSITAYSDGGFTIGGSARINRSGRPYRYFTISEMPGLFSRVEWTGDGSNDRTIAHDLGVPAGLVLMRRLDGPSNLVAAFPSGTVNLTDDNPAKSDNYAVRSLGNAAGFRISNSPDANGFSYNAPGATYVAYVFANSDLIQVGYTYGDITLPWAAQFIVTRFTTTQTSGFWDAYASSVLDAGGAWYGLRFTMGWSSGDVLYPSADKRTFASPQGKPYGAAYLAIRASGG